MFRLAHLSDPHLGPLPDVRYRQLASKRAIGYVNWRRNRAVKLGSDSLDILLADLEMAAPDHLAVTGDLVNLALPEEIKLAAAWLDTLGSPTGVTVVPGNHDAYVPGAVGRAGRHWAAFMQGDPDRAVSDEPDSNGVLGARFPFVRRRGPIAIVGTSSARASAPFMATGHFGTTQSLILTEILEALRHEGLFRVVLIHHPPVRGSTPWHKRLIGGSRFRAAIREAGAELVLHGHNHRAGVLHIKGRDGRVPVVGVPSASATPDERHEGARYNLFEIDGGPGAWHCRMIERGLTPEAPETVEEISSRLLMRPRSRAAKSPLS